MAFILSFVADFLFWFALVMLSLIVFRTKKSADLSTEVLAFTGIIFLAAFVAQTLYG